MTGRTHYANIRPKPHNLPFIATARMRFTQTYNIMQVKLERHSIYHYSTGYSHTSNLRKKYYQRQNSYGNDLYNENVWRNWLRHTLD